MTENRMPQACARPQVPVALLALVRLVLDQPAGRIERRGLDERIVGAPMQRDDGRGMSMRDLTHLFVAGGARRPEQEQPPDQGSTIMLCAASPPVYQRKPNIGLILPR